MMLWSEELNALLNQCVFEAGYDFTVAAALLLRRGKQLRLLRDEDVELGLSSDECQVQWMTINPIEDDQDQEEEPEFHFYQQHRSPSPLSPEEEPLDDLGGSNEVRGASLLVDPVDPEPLAVTDRLDVPDGCPRLELSLSDAELDVLLNSLPVDGRADAKATYPTSSGSNEMQWVLSFLTDPDAIAHRDADAKNLLLEPQDKREDDNYQFFLQQLNQANLLGPAKPITIETPREAIDVDSNDESDPENAEGDNSTDHDDEGDEDDDDWEQARQQIKQQLPVERDTSSSRAETQPPAPPTRFPPRSMSTSTASRTVDGKGSASTRLALSREIGASLQKHGAFQFPKRLFPAPELQP
ncbi:hypothetical protein Poli38472_004455 [Pythium oligandrum]|uniref:Uncharacterized protein n=1 Tax=Pythium oligandrum TaxID=41045 RepID=A0A8K1FEG0_PYTOL|nr:hypothetical protein Poli38472_004455 [Pythium oligandrum]|eukprot:TMW59386.1 hypothetical protein Poli38472_004455 [Pythium oligandrum]